MNYRMNVVILSILCMFLIHNAHSAVITVNTAEESVVRSGITNKGVKICTFREAVTAANLNIPINGCPTGEDAVVDVIEIDVTEPLRIVAELVITDSVRIEPADGITSFTIEVQSAAPTSNFTNNSMLVVRPADSIEMEFYMHSGTFNGNGDTQSAPLRAILFDGEVDGLLGLVDISETVFDHHTADQGGALYFKDVPPLTINLLNNTFTDNSASVNGGAVAINRRSFDPSSLLRGGLEFSSEIRDNVFLNNSAGLDGGALHVLDDSSETLLIFSNLFRGNKSLGNGGAMYLSVLGENQGSIATFDLYNNSVIFNQAGSNGGGLYTTGNTQTYITNSTFGFNTSTSGGAIYSDNLKFGLHFSTLAFNTASQSADSLWAGNTALDAFYNIFSKAINQNHCNDPEDLLLHRGSLDTGTNLLDQATCSWLDSDHTAILSEPGLTGLIDRLGGKLPGFEPVADSPAIDQNTGNCSNDRLELYFDQQGSARPQDGDGDDLSSCDLGAIEATSGTDVIWLDGFGF